MGIDGGKQQLPSTELCEHDMSSYCKEMSSLLSNICVQVKAAQGKVAETPLHDIKPGDFVVVRDLRRKSWRATWIHTSHCRKVPSAPQEEERREYEIGDACQQMPESPVNTECLYDCKWICGESKA